MLEQQKLFATTSGNGEYGSGNYPESAGKSAKHKGSNRILEFRGCSQFDAGHEELFDITAQRVLLEIFN